MFEKLTNLKRNNLNHFFAIMIISFFPFFLFSSLFTNLFVVILALLFLTQFKFFKKDIVHDKVFFFIDVIFVFYSN